MGSTPTWEIKIVGQMVPAIWIDFNEREEFLKEKGFFCIGRCRWKTFKSFNDEEKRNYILELVAKIREL